MAQPPPYILPTMAENYKLNITIPIYSKNPKNLIALFCDGKPFEECLISEKSYIDRTEYDIRHELSIGLLKIKFVVYVNPKDKGFKIISDKHFKYNTYISITSKSYNSNITYNPFCDTAVLANSLNNLPASITPFNSLELMNNKDMRREFVTKVIKSYIKEDFYIGPALSESELDTIAAARKILENIGRTL